MSDLIICGSPREKGYSYKALEILLEDINSKERIISAYELDISPCVDCRYCFENSSCSQKDDMEEIYNKIDNCQRVIISTPIYFFGIPGPMKNIIDRCQVYWAANKRGEIKKNIINESYVIFVGGANKFKNQFYAAEMTMESFLNDISAKKKKFIYLPGTDKGYTDKEIRIIIENQL